VNIWRATPGAEEQVKAAEALFDDPVDVAATRRFLANEANVLLIAYVERNPAGFVSGTELSHPDKADPEMFLNELGVDEVYRGRGIGRTLVGAFWKLAQERGCRGMWVLTDEDNAPANKVYGAAGGVRARTEVMYQWGED
jgi:ribosomal protein S18 acetylase RimI-like enzyme